MNEETIHNLEALGFTTYESKVFCALFESNKMTGSEIAKAAKIPRSSAYDIIKSFTQKGFCNEIQTSSVVLYELIDPIVVEDKLSHEINNTARVRLDKLKDSFDKLKPLFKSKSKEKEKVDVELIKGFNKHRRFKFWNLLNETSKELLLMTRLEGNISKESDEASQALIKRGGKIRSIYEASLNFKIKIEGTWNNVNPEGLVEICEKFVKQGEQIKLTNKVHQNLAIFDRKIVFVSLVDPEIPVYNRSDVIIKNEFYANAMVDYFDSCWDSSDSVEQFKNKLIGDINHPKSN
jgi:sugar-specific transcriptional regulator TrmB